MQFSRTLKSENETTKTAASFASCCLPQTTIYLEGEVGAGKTTFARAFIQAMGYKGRVKSPTFTLVEPYQINHGLDIYHFDLYRLENPNELEHIGVDEYFNPQSICLIEWPEHGKGILPLADISCHLSREENTCSIHFSAETTHGKLMLSALGEVACE